MPLHFDKDHDVYGFPTTDKYGTVAIGLRVLSRSFQVPRTEYGWIIVHAIGRASPAD